MTDKLKLTKTDKEGVLVGVRSNNRKYSVRNDRHRFFYPNEWNLFIKEIRAKNKPLFAFLINTGARIDEALNIRPIDFDFDRNNVRIWKTKTKAAKGDRVGQVRTISLSTAFCKYIKKECKKLDSKERIFKTAAVSNWALLRRTLERIGIDDWYNFSLHNIRKTHGMWLKAIGVDAGEICLRLGHDMNTFIRHYGSSDLFNETDRRMIEQNLDDLYLRRRRY